MPKLKVGDTLYEVGVKKLKAGDIVSVLENSECVVRRPCVRLAMQDTEAVHASRISAKPIKQNA